MISYCFPTKNIFKLSLTPWIYIFGKNAGHCENCVVLWEIGLSGEKKSSDQCNAVQSFTKCHECV